MFPAQVRENVYSEPRTPSFHVLITALHTFDRFVKIAGLPLEK